MFHVTDILFKFLVFFGAAILAITPDEALNFLPLPLMRLIEMKFNNDSAIIDVRCFIEQYFELFCHIRFNRIWFLCYVFLI